MPPDEKFLRLAIALARQGRERGGHPFGAVLVRDGEVMHQVYDRCVELSDPTYHSELSLISEYCRTHRIMSLEGYTLYASTEPCPMCASAIHWARISRVVFSVSQAMLQERSGGSPKPSAASIMNSGQQPIEVVGPLIPEEGLAVFEGYMFAAQRASRPASRDGGSGPTA
jgi:tRNA(Arg) A34 adenosine deaminase TadA